MKFIRIIKNWWDGKDTGITEINGANFMIGLINEKHWTSKYAHVAAAWLGKYWTWVITTILAIVVAL